MTRATPERATASSQAIPCLIWKYRTSMGHPFARWRPAFLIGFQRVQGRNPFSAFATQPSLFERNGDFSKSVAVGPVTIYDPLNAQIFPDNQIPRSRIRPA